MSSRRKPNHSGKLDLSTHTCVSSSAPALTIHDSVFKALTGAALGKTNKSLSRSALQLLTRIALAAANTEPPQVDCSVCCGERDTCVNCDAVLDQPRLFCTEACQQQAGLVRYLRRTIEDGRILDNEILEAVGTRIVILNGGGYPARARKISQARRDEIILRDRSVCQICGKPGTEIDHIDGSSDDPANLRLLCGPCNRRRVEIAIRTVTANSDPELFAYIEALAEDTAHRAAAGLPIRFVDDAGWSTQWRIVQNRLRTRWSD